MTVNPELPRTTGEWLEQSGWNRNGETKARWDLQTETGIAALSLQSVSSSWQAWFLQGGEVPETSTVRLLRGNLSLSGPFKFVRGSRGRSLCRADLPMELLESQGESIGGSFDAIQHPVEAWAESLTALACGSRIEETASVPSSSELAASLEKKGWSTASDNGAIRVHMPLPGLFRQVTIETASDGGTRLWCELVDLHGWPLVSRRAALYLAHQANDQLHLVRFALAGEGSCRLRAEVNLANVRVPGVWLDMALHAMQTAIHLTARELAALREPELAAWTLAAAAAGGRKEVGFDRCNAR